MPKLTPDAYQSKEKDLTKKPEFKPAPKTYQSRIRYTPPPPPRDEPDPDKKESSNWILPPLPEDLKSSSAFQEHPSSGRGWLADAIEQKRTAEEAKVEEEESDDIDYADFGKPFDSREIESLFNMGALLDNQIDDLFSTPKAGVNLDPLILNNPELAEQLELNPDTANHFAAPESLRMLNETERGLDNMMQSSVLDRREQEETDEPILRRTDEILSGFRNKIWETVGQKSQSGSTRLDRDTAGKISSLPGATIETPKADLPSTGLSGFKMMDTPGMISTPNRFETHTRPDQNLEPLGGMPSLRMTDRDKSSGYNQDITLPTKKSYTPNSDEIRSTLSPSRSLPGSFKRSQVFQPLDPKKQHR